MPAAGTGPHIIAAMASSSRIPTTLLKLAIANNWASQMFDQEMKRRGLNPAQFGVLMLIRIHEPVTPGDLHWESGIAPATVRLKVHQLVGAGLVKRMPNIEDKRSHYLTTTPAGKRVLRTVYAAAKAVESRLDIKPGGALEDLTALLDVVIEDAREMSHDEFLSGPGAEVGSW